MFVLGNFSQVNERTKKLETRKRALTAHQKFKREHTLGYSKAKHHRHGYSRRLLEASGHIAPRSIAKLKREAKILRQIVEHQEVKSGSNNDN